MKLTINELNLSSDTLVIPAQGSANVPVEVENISSKYNDYAIVPCVGWIKNGIVFSTTRSISKENIFTIPSNAFENSGPIYISVGLVKNDEKIMTNQIVFFVSEAPNSEIELPSNEIWATAVSSLVTSLFNERFENEINKILDNAKTLNQETKNLQEQINTAIGYLGEYEWSGTQIRFKLGDGTWGEYHDIAGDFATKNDLKTINTYTKQLFLEFHPVNTIYETTNDESPQDVFGGKWVLFEKNHPTYSITDSKVVNGGGQNWVTLDTSSNIQNLFMSKYSVSPDVSKLAITFTNGDTNATDRRIIASDISENGKYVNAIFDSPHSGQIRLNYIITYVETSKIIYKWERTA